MCVTLGNTDFFKFQCFSIDSYARQKYKREWERDISNTQRSVIYYCTKISQSLQHIICWSNQNSSKDKKCVVKIQHWGKTKSLFLIFGFENSVKMSENLKQTSLVGNDSVVELVFTDISVLETFMEFIQPENINDYIKYCMLDLKYSFSCKLSAKQWQVSIKVLLWLFIILTLVKNIQSFIYIQH